MKPSRGTVADMVPRVWDERAMARAYDSADALRKAWAWDLRGEQHVDFVVRPACGGGALKKYGRLTEGLRGEAATAAAREFVDQFAHTLQGSITFSTEKFTLSEVRAMATEWCNRMQFLLNVWDDRGQDDDLAALGEWRIGSHVEKAAFTAIADVPGGPRAELLVRILQVRGFMPS